MTETIRQSPSAVLGVLGLPAVDVLTADQTRGAVCVWCTERLTAETAVDLGERSGPDGRWWPRACRPHLTTRALHALFEHAPGCADCRETPPPGERSRCEVGRVLVQLTKDPR
ncbi:hypothetical protein ABZ023_07110 [Streptomyces sp. NPDC006367]|uniref:hypothetical protein n=1 Tax=unclassified Streptomyces TaxID=2593676 RepID=UPI0033BAC191